MLQKRLASEMTTMVHSKKELDASVEASAILFGRGTTESLKRMNENTFLSVFDGVPTFDVSSDLIKEGVNLVDLCSLHTRIFSSKGEMRRLLQGGGLSVNKDKISDADVLVDESFLLNNKYILVQKGKKNYFVIRVV